MSAAQRQAVAALGVLTNTPEIRAWLRDNDPQALRQAEAAFDAVRAAQSRPLDALANAVHSVSRHHEGNDESPLTSPQIAVLRQAAHVLFTLAEAGWTE